VDVVDETGETVVGDGAAEGTDKIEDDLERLSTWTAFLGAQMRL
jgi:hypothetical protein